MWPKTLFGVCKYQMLFIISSEAKKSSPLIKDLINFLNIEVSNDFIFKCNNKKNIDITYDHEIYKRAYNTYIKFNVK